MGRPSVAAERRLQVLAAARRVMTAYGLAGTTLERIAEEANMVRGHVRHFAGNREDILTDIAREFYFEGTLGSSFFPAEVTSVQQAIDYLFSSEFTGPDSENAVIHGLVEASRTIPAIAEIMDKAYLGTRQTLVAMLRLHRPHADEQVLEQIAYGLLTVGLGNAFINDLTPAPELTAAGRAAAGRLLATLD